MRYAVDPSQVSHDRQQDEVIIINAASGAYYSGSGAAADVWTLISQGMTVSESARILASEYACEEATVLRDIDKCVRSLIERGLIQENDKDTRPRVPYDLPQAVRTTWTTPEFDEYTDMWDLIRLDPIHEDGDAGWPFADPKAKI
jgi:hypothetical protein